MLTMVEMRERLLPTLLGLALIVAGCSADGIEATPVDVGVLSGALTASSVAPAVPVTASRPAPTTTTTAPDPPCMNAGFAFADENPEADELRARIDRVFDHWGFEGHDVSVSVWVDGWGEIATHNPNLRLHPASNQKVLTAIGANELLDPTASLITRIELVGNDLVIRPGGDPTLTFPRLLEAIYICLLYTSPSPRDATLSRMPSSA